MNIDFTTIAQGTNSGYQSASQTVIDNQEQWINLWQQHTSDTEPSPPVPQVDFMSYNVAAIFAGEKSTGGYSVEILAVETRNSKTGDQPSLVITVQYHQPQPEDYVTEAMTYPYQMIKIPQIDVKKVVFEQA
ncbi:protease complex subunit PrcB family protein [Microcoleus sp.]|uniref:protease complex subunit PrcB family protein n=1 Tax=Microcoleus sp. TaxID=44472 RepID=UPI00403EAC5F